MKTNDFIPAVLLGLWMILASCQEPSNEKPAKKPSLAGVLDVSSGRLYTDSDQRDSVLKVLEAREVMDSIVREEQLFYTNQMDSTVYFTIETTADLQVFALDLAGAAFPVGFLGIKIWVDASCNVNHPGFMAPCMRTFGRHRNFGNSMHWTVNTWKSCGSGAGYCMEILKKVGDIYYYPDFNCGDSVFVRQNLRQFRCD